MAKFFKVFFLYYPRLTFMRIFSEIGSLDNTQSELQCRKEIESYGKLMGTYPDFSATSYYFLSYYKQKTIKYLTKRIKLKS